MRVLLVTSWETPCGIAEHSRLLREYVQRADPDIEITPSSAALDPEQLEGSTWSGDLIHLNHHDALHARWTPDHVARITARGIPVLVTYHDTTEDPSPTSKLAQLARVASSVVVHEPLHPDCRVKAIYWRQGIPDAAREPYLYRAVDNRCWWEPRPLLFKAYLQQPVLGAVGFHFPWKNYDRLCVETASLGWAIVILANNATEADAVRWHTLNPDALVIRTWLDTPRVVNYLAGCDATAFMYECANTGTSGAIRLGIAARKPVIALESCRQFRDLRLWEEENRLDTTVISWVRDWEGFRGILHGCGSTRYDPYIHMLAEQDSWQRLGQQYAQLYRMLAAK